MTRKELESVYYLKKQLRMWQGRIAELQADIAISSKPIDGMPFANTNEVTSPTETKAIELVEVAKVIEGKISEIKITIAEIEKFIVNVDDPIISQILEYRCIKLMTWNEIAIKLGASYSAENARQMYHRYITANL